jgi:hypothetical protein
MEPVTAAEPAPPVAASERFGAWDAVPPPRPVSPSPVAEPVAPAPVAEPAAIVEPPRAYDAFAGLPLLQTAEPVRTFEPIVPVVEQPPVAAPEPDPMNGLDRQWSDSHRLTETSTFRAHGGTRLTPRRSTTRTSTR